MQKNLPGRAVARLLCGATASALLLAAGAAGAAEWSNAFIGYTYGEKFKEPGNTKDVQKQVFQLNYIGGYSLGTNFFNVNMFKSSTVDPAGGPTPSQTSNRGAQEIYVVYANTMSLSKLTGTKLAFSGVKDVNFRAGFDFNSKNDTFGAGLTKYIAGPQLAFDVPGLLTLGLFYFKENNNNGIVGQKINFDPTYKLESLWQFDFNLGAPARFKGFASYTGAKGKDAFGLDTAPETWVDSTLVWDVGSLWGSKGTWYAGGGFQFIRNKFGNDAALVPGTKVNAPYLKVEAHF